MSGQTVLKILLLSAGGMVGQNALDALEGRRGDLLLLGTNSEARNPRNFRCDKVFLVPPTTEREAFTRRVFGILESESPDLVLAGRDDDVLAMATWWERHPEWRGRFSCGSLNAAEIMRNKSRSFQFARERGLSFADSAVGEAGQPSPALEALLAKYGFPLIAKPCVGCGSKGVYIVHDTGQLQRLLGRGGYIFQEYLDLRPGLDLLQKELELGTPLFFSLPEETQVACQTAISPEGKVGGIFCSRVRMVGGNPEGSERVDDPALEKLTRAYAEALSAEGWAGPLNLQCKPRSTGEYAVFELNGRMTGSTSARRHLGFDEIGNLVEMFVGPGRLMKAQIQAPLPRWVMRTAVDSPLMESQVSILEEDGQCERSS